MINTSFKNGYVGQYDIILISGYLGLVLNPSNLDSSLGLLYFSHLSAKVSFLCMRAPCSKGSNSLRFY